MFFNRHIAALLKTGSGNARKLSLKFCGSDEAARLQGGVARTFSKTDLWKVWLGSELMGVGFNLKTAAGTLDIVWPKLERLDLMPGGSLPKVVYELRIYQLRRLEPEPGLGGPEGVPFLRAVMSRRQIKNALRYAEKPLPIEHGEMVEEVYQDHPAVSAMDDNKFRRSVCVCINISEILAEFEFALRKLELSEF